MARGEWSSVERTTDGENPRASQKISFVASARGRRLNGFSPCRRPDDQLQKSPSIAAQGCETSSLPRVGSKIPINPTTSTTTGKFVLPATSKKTASRYLETTYEFAADPNGDFVNCMVATPVEVSIHQNNHSQLSDPPHHDAVSLAPHDLHRSLRFDVISVADHVEQLPLKHGFTRRPEHRLGFSHRP